MSEVAICNAALTMMGSDAITALTDNNVRARTMSLRYADTRDAELQKRRWKFSISRASLPALAEEPASDFAYQYQLPVDYLRLIEGGDIADVPDLSDLRTGGNELFSIEGDKILTNIGAPLNIRYIRRVTDTALFNASFRKYLACVLAFDNCERITQSAEKKETLRTDKKEALRESVRANALEAPPRQQPDSEWVAARSM